MFTLIMSIVASILSFYLTSNYIYFSLIALGIYFLIRKNLKAETFAGLNLVLISAISLLGKFRPYSLEGLNFLIIGSFFVILYDIIKEWYSLIPMFILTGIGISLIASVKYGKIGMLIGLILIPVLIREYTIQKKIEK
ncbi:MULTISPECIES: hypothetical protein [Fervidobacterium]|uniref:Uncharacterized protein n=1 Tax=Fervidobacterium nodosum (strain ATCC 35602 / DSM 5306 / Rt17-B1) TaxID=381764 RepID=A7HKM8_FERNB|nr:MULTISPECIES: hypothetical protein [Fervidobacterium]ABS60461.1 hypothetical protein Fnod_0606 [Fervidobacterium nodosum Rt17-B1]KAF2962573.1 hypothetical protein AS161_00725 [Fervidobacterium sp. 2310opik-2]PHJ14552.1 hypothetical protein IM41_00215 [Fervidobacterium sp. SC_NGM5_G05]HOJ94221.1 hypothetical protein [Fervidobacterium nodosum]